MKIVFMGTPDFAVPSLKKLIEHHEVVGVITAVDKPSGRGKKIRHSAVKEAALDLGLKVLQPINLKDTVFHSKLEALGADLFVVVAFRMLPHAVWSMPPKGTINLHGSLLPDYRGAAPINRAIMNGETKTGLTTFFINENIDTGAIIDSVTCEIGENETAGDLHDKMMELGAGLLVDTVIDIEKGSVASKDQLESAELKMAHKIFKKDCQIFWNQPAKVIHDHIRGLSPYPAAFSLVSEGDFDRVKIFKTMITDRESGDNPGEIDSSKGKLYVQTKDFFLEILEIQVPGKKRGTVQSFLNGYQLSDSFKFLS
ncbi:MAG: methionyl-tRNA formyltransferase [Flavobacteriales bacterium]|nr:methionyl-tRNA formyltransferase [Flavobacteriales bacterium]